MAGFRIIQCSSLILLIFGFITKSVIHAQNHFQWHKLSTEQARCIPSSRLKLWRALKSTACLLSYPRTPAIATPSGAATRTSTALHGLAACLQMLFFSPQRRARPRHTNNSSTFTCEHQAGIFQFFLGNLEAEGLIVEGIYRPPHAGGFLGFC